MESSAVKTNVANLALIIDQMKAVNDLLPRFKATISEWSASNEQFTNRLRRIADEIEKRIECLQNIVVSPSKNINTTQQSGSALVAQAVKTAPIKRSLPSTSQKEPIPQPKRMKSNENKMAASRKSQLNWMLII